MTIVNLPTPLPPYEPGIYPLPQVTPFTFRDGASFLERIERLIYWVNNVVLVQLNEQMNELGDEVTGEINSLITQVNDAVQQVINSSISLQDAVLNGIITNEESESRLALDNLYATISSVTGIDARVTDLETLTSTGRLGADAVTQGIIATLADRIVDNTVDLQTQINAAIAAGEGVVKLIRNKVYNVSSPLETSGADTASTRQSVMLVGPAIIKPMNTFTGSHVIKHTQNVAQASANSMGYGAGLKDITIDGSNLIASNVSGVRYDGCWMPRFENVTIRNMSGDGISFLADATINAVDDTYAAVDAILTGVTVTNCQGWGIYQSRFAGPFTARGLYLNNNVKGGARITAPHVNWEVGAAANNGGPGLYVTKADSAGGSTLSEMIIRSVEFDTNAVNNIWIDNAINCTLESLRLITREVSGAYVTTSLVRLGGTPGNSVNAITINKPYIRANQQTDNPPFTIYQFDSQASYCRVIDHYELTGSSTNKTVATTSGAFNTIQLVTGEYLFSDSDRDATAYASASLTNALTVSTVQADIIWDTVTVDRTARYNNTTGEYSFKNDNGLFRISGFLTVQAAAATTARRVRFALRYFDGTAYSTVKYASVSVDPSNLDQIIPFDFMIMVVSQNAKVKIAADASTGTAILVGSQNTDFRVNKLN